MTIADIARPRKQWLAALYDVIVVLAGSLLIGLSAQIAVGWPVPITGQTFGVLMVGAVLGARRGSLCVLTYLLEGLVGLPVFSYGRAGLAVLAGPTGGYLVGFVGAAYVVGLLAERRWDRRFGTTIAAMALGNVVLHAAGLLWLWCLVKLFGMQLGGRSIAAVGLYPFVVGDLLKIVLAAVLLPTVWKLLKTPHPGGRIGC